MKKSKSETEMRRNILYHSKLLGCDGEAVKIFNRYDNLLKNCSNQKERMQIQIMGVAELHKLLQCKGALVINGELIIPQDPNYKKEE